MQPSVLKLGAVKINGPHISIRIVSTSKDTTRIRILATQISHSSQITLTTVTISTFITPTTTVIPIVRSSSITQFSFRITVGIIGNCMNGSTRLTVKHRQIFLSSVNSTTAHTPIFRIAGCLDSIIGRSLINIITHTILTTWSGLTNQFGLPILIEVIHQKLRIVSTSTNIVAQINTPQLCAIQFVAVNIHTSSISATDGIILRSRWIPLHKNLILPITIHIAHTTIVGRIGVGHWSRIFIICFFITILWMINTPILNGSA